MDAVNVFTFYYLVYSFILVLFWSIHFVFEGVWGNLHTSYMFSILVCLYSPGITAGKDYTLTRLQDRLVHPAPAELDIAVLNKKFHC